MRPPPWQTRPRQAMDLGLLIERGTGRLAVGAPGTFTGTAGFDQRVRPRSLELEDRGTMHEARPGKSDHLGLLLAHARECRRPFARAAEGIDLSAGSITLQYIKPVMIGDSSPATTASIVSSRRLRPVQTSPCWMSARPCR